MNNLKRHTLSSSGNVSRIAYDPSKQHLYMEFPNGVYRYEGVPDHHFDNVVSAKDRNEAIGEEKPGSEGSYVIHHIIGKDRKNPPFKYEKVHPADAADLFPFELKESQ